MRLTGGLHCAGAGASRGTVVLALALPRGLSAGSYSESLDRVAGGLARAVHARGARAAAVRRGRVTLVWPVRVYIKNLCHAPARPDVLCCNAAMLSNAGPCLRCQTHGLTLEFALGRAFRRHPLGFSVFVFSQRNKQKCNQEGSDSGGRRAPARLAARTRLPTRAQRPRPRRVDAACCARNRALDLRPPRPFLHEARLPGSGLSGRA